MRNSLLVVATGICALAAAAAPARAADLSAAPSFQVPPRAPAYNWTGLYFGVNGGYGRGQQDPLNIITNRFDAFSVSYSGGALGGTAGAQIQAGHVVLGIETDVDWANIKGTAVITPTIFGVFQPTVNLTTNIDTISTARMRVGYAQDNWLLYGTAGLALLGANTSATTVGGVACTLPLLGAVCSGTSYRVGAAAGAGFEYGFTPSLSAKLEYLYVAAIAVQVSHVDMVRAGLNFRFGGN